MDLEPIRTLARRGELEQAHGLFHRSRLHELEDLTALREAAELAEELGLVQQARTLYRKALSIDPGQASLRAALEELDRELDSGAPDLALEPTPEPVPAPTPSGPRGPTARPRRQVADLPPYGNPDLARFLHLFGGREDVHAKQWYRPPKGGGYSPIREPLTIERLRQHVGGRVTLGSYLLRIDQTVTCFVLDLDIARWAIDRARGNLERSRELRRTVHLAGLTMAERARDELGMPLLLEDSGYKGRHLWGFLTEPADGELVHRFGKVLAKHLRPSHKALSVEFFPKQGKVAPGGLGNLVKLPLGIHRVSGRRAMLLTFDGAVAPDPWELLRQVRPFRPGTLLETMGALRSGATRGGGADPLPQELLSDFVASDLETIPELAALLGRCPVLAALVRKALETRRLTHDEQTVLIHSLGHFPAGVRAANFLLMRCPEVKAHRYIKGILRGHPVSCPKVRHRIPALTASVSCHCAFGAHDEHYPTPLLHLDEAAAAGELPRPVAWTSGGAARGGPGEATAALPASNVEETPVPPAPAEPQTPDPLAERGRRLAALYEEQRSLNRRLDGERRELAAAMDHEGRRALQVDGGIWRLHLGAEGPRLTWSPATDEEG